MTRFLQISKWGTFSLLGLLLLAFIGLQAYRIYLRNSTRIETSNGISSLEEITLGGAKQWIFVRGQDPRNPVLIFLHGGPGEPTGGMSSSRSLDAELIKHFTVVHWDQRGAGKSYHREIPVDSMTFDRWVQDCNELIDYTRERFNVPKVFLVAHSAGTSLGIKVAYQYPEKLYAYVGVAQVVNDYEQQKTSFEFVVREAEKAGDVRAQNALRALGPPPYETPQQEYKKARYVGRYGGFVHGNPLKQVGVLWLSYLTSPEYSLLEALETMSGKGRDFTTNARWDEIREIDFTREIPSLQVSTYLIVGKHDMITPAVLVEEFYHHLEAEQGKHLFVFESSGHFPPVEESARYQELLIDVVLQESHN
jgi:pimeloyl-ACP methyl ester carboxylesterase